MNMFIWVQALSKMLPIILHYHTKMSSMSSTSYENVIYYDLWERCTVQSMSWCRIHYADKQKKHANVTTALFKAIERYWPLFASNPINILLVRALCFLNTRYLPQLMTERLRYLPCCINVLSHSSLLPPDPVDPAKVMVCMCHTVGPLIVFTCVYPGVPSVMFFIPYNPIN